MAWSAPRTWSTAEVVTAAMMNPHVRDNLLYLKGSSGPVSIDNTIASLIAAGGASVEAQGTTAGSNSRFRLLAKRTAGSVVVDWRIFANALSDAGELSIYDATAAAERLRIDNAGNVGIGTAAPQGKLHAVGAGGGIMFLSVAAVTSIVTIAVAGTVTNSAFFWLTDHNNTTGTGVGALNGTQVAVGGNTTYANTDTMEVAVTAGGAITFRRSVGTNGTHDMRCWVQYK